MIGYREKIALKFLFIRADKGSLEDVVNLKWTKPMHLLVILAFAAMAGCSGDSGGFSGQNGQAAMPKEVVVENENSDGEEQTPQKTTSGRADSSLGQVVEGDSKEDALGKATSSVAPDSAVTKGSFTVWADPASPLPMQAYWIHVEVKLPTNVSSYVQTDLSGILQGTDGYSRGIGRDSKTKSQSSYWTLPDKFQAYSDRALVSINVPGAASLVRDTIRITSDLLGESQNIEIIFK